MRFGPEKDGKTEWFAWRPVRLYSGQWVWLERVVTYDYFDPCVPIKVSYNPFTGRVFYPVGEGRLTWTSCSI